jgi:hypothetical protein
MSVEEIDDLHSRLAETPLNLAWGAAEIGAEINLSARQVFHLLNAGGLDGVAVKVNGKWAADRCLLRARFRPAAVNRDEQAAA